MIFAATYSATVGRFTGAASRLFTDHAEGGMGAIDLFQMAPPAFAWPLPHTSQRGGDNDASVLQSPNKVRA
jgi:hypothetical protein